MYATDGGEDDARQERGPQPSPAVRADENRGAIDVQVVRRPDIEILRHVEGEVRIANSGDIGAGTMLWRRDGDVRFKGKSDPCDLDESLIVRTTNGGDEYFEHLQILAMSNGELLVCWAEHATSNLTDTSWNWYLRIFDPRSYQFGPIIQLPNVTAAGVSVERSDRGDNPAIAVAESDTEPGHLTAVGMANVLNAPNPTVFHCITFTSRDYGRTWNIQSINPDIHGSGAGTQTGIFSLDCLYSNGRLVLAIEYNGAAESPDMFYSNDSGVSWVFSQQILTDNNASQGGICLTKTHNGALLCFAADQRNVVGNFLQVAWSGTNGATWVDFTAPDVPASDTGATADRGAHWPAAILDDSGRVCLYWYCRDGTDDAMYFSRLGIRDITLTEVEAVANPFDGQVEHRCGSVWDSIIANDPEVQVIAADSWRGRMGLVTYYFDDERTILLHLNNRWNGVRVKAHNGQNQSWFHVFLPQDHPDVHGSGYFTWALTGQKTNNQLFENGGYYIEDNKVNADYFTSAALPTAPLIVKVLCRCLDGGNLAAREVFWTMENAVDNLKVECWMSTAGFQMRDPNGAGADIGPEIATDLTKWHEFLVYVNEGDQELVQVYWRVLDPENDGEFVQYNELLGANVALDTTAVAASQLLFGHTDMASAKSEWRAFKVNDVDAASTEPRVYVYNPDNVFDEFYTTDLVQAASDRAPQISETMMNLAEGLGAAWVGSGALARNRWDIATRADFPKERLLDGGPLQPWGAILSSLDRLQLPVAEDRDERRRRLGGTPAVDLGGAGRRSHCRDVLPSWREDPHASG